MLPPTRARRIETLGKTGSVGSWGPNGEARWFVASRQTFEERDFREFRHRVPSLWPPCPRVGAQPVGLRLVRLAWPRGADRWTGAERRGGPPTRRRAGLLGRSLHW